MKKKLTITISGEAASGKSRLTYYLKEMLRQNGFYDIKLGSSTDFPNEVMFDRDMKKDIEDIIEKMNETTEIIVKEAQLPHNVDKMDFELKKSVAERYGGNKNTTNEDSNTMEDRLKYMTKEQVEDERVQILNELRETLHVEGVDGRTSRQAVSQKIDYFLSNEHRWVKSIKE